MHWFHVEKKCPTGKTEKKVSVNIDLYSKNCSYFSQQHSIHPPFQ